MQGQRGTVGSLPETLDFDLVNSSNNSAMDQQMCWNNMRNPPENRLPDYLLPTDMNIAFVNSMGRERQGLSRWCSNEASSSNTQNEAVHGERKLELGWPSPGLIPVHGPRLEEPRREQASSSVLPDNSASLMFPQSSNSNSIQPSLNLGFAGHSGSVGGSQVMEFPNAFKFGGSESEQNRAASSSVPFQLPSGSGGFLGVENDGRQSSMDGRRISCKRKAIEGNVGPSSSSGSSSYFQHTESSSARPGLPVRVGSGSGLSIHSSSEQGTPRLGLGLPDPIVAENPEISHRNLRVRMSSTSQQNTVTPIVSSSRAVRRSSVLPSQPSMNFLPVDNGLEIRPISAVENLHSQSQPGIIDAPLLQQHIHSRRWTGASASRNTGPSSSVAFVDRDPQPREELPSRNFPRTIPELAIPAMELRNLIRHQTRSVSGGTVSIPANNAATSRPGSSSNVNPSPAPVWPPHHNPPQYPRRFSEYLRRSLFSSAGAESGVQMSNPVLRPGHPGSSSQEMLLPSGAGNLGHHHPHPRLASWLERHNDNGLGIHYSLRSLGAGGEGSSRLVSEIRNVLGLIRRGESLRFEDVMILDPSIFAGVADLHDRHRDMRLDVDNMSYEELLALEERIGNVSTGLTEETISKHLKQKKYLISGKPQSEIEPCCVCQEDYNEGDDMGTLECNHDFHTDCIKQWLTHKNICPICKTTALQT